MVLQESELKLKVENQIGLDRQHFRRGKTELIPKKSTVIRVNPEFQSILSTREGNEFTLEGEGFLPGDFLFGRRTIFLEKPVEIAGETYYLEVKGYGQNGRELYGHKHVEGDLFYGMFLDNAAREFDYPKDLGEKGIRDLQKPVALMRIPQEIYIEEVLKTLPQVISARVAFGKDKIRSTAAKLFPHLGDDTPLATSNWTDEERDEIGQEITERLRIAYDLERLEGIRKLADKLGVGEEVEGILDNREVGYVIRAVKSPFRVGDGVKENLNARTQEIARKMGEISRRMLEFGYLNVSPNPGNWTTEGELVDFEDVLKLPEDIHALRETALFWTKRKSMKNCSVESLIEMSYGEFMIGVFTPYFQEGFMTGRTNTRSVVQKAVQILRSQNLGLDMLP